MAFNCEYKIAYVNKKPYVAQLRKWGYKILNQQLKNMQ